MWRVTFTAPLPAHARAFDIVSLRGWDNAGLQVHDSRFFGGIDGVHCKSNGALFANNAMACTGFDVSPWQHYLEGPAPPKPNSVAFLASCSLRRASYRHWATQRVVPSLR